MSLSSTDKLSPLRFCMISLQFYMFGLSRCFRYWVSLPLSPSNTQTVPSQLGLALNGSGRQPQSFSIFLSELGNRNLKILFELDLSNNSYEWEKHYILSGRDKLTCSSCPGLS